MASKKAQGEVGAIQIPRFKYIEATFTIRGRTPLVMHRFSERAKDEIEGKQAQKPGLKKREARDPEREVKEALYMMNDGSVGFPARAIKKALTTAGSRYTGLTKVMLNGAIKVRSFDPSENLPVRCADPVGRRDVVRLPGPSRTVDLRYRPEFAAWEIDVPIRYNATLLSMEQVSHLFEIAGEMIGIGDGRVETGMSWGEFEVAKVRQS